MAESINWLHISDLHFGLDPEGWMWPRIKTEILRDAERLISSFGGVDLVIFTGDFVQKGDPKEFDALNRELEAMWKVFVKCGRVPKLCAIPGNHDIKRPSLDSATTKALTKLWHLDEDLRTKFWKEPDCEYRAAVRDYFKPYTDWLENVPVPQLSVTRGILPGDFSGVFEMGEISLGVVGLNTTFLQICDSLGKGTLDVHVSQLNAVCGGNPDDWIQSKKANILLTHQPMDWLSKSGQEHFKEEIYIPGRFFAIIMATNTSLMRMNYHKLDLFPEEIAKRPHYLVLSIALMVRASESMGITQGSLFLIRITHLSIFGLASE